MNVPRIRFKGFDGEWKITSFLNIAERISILANYRNLPCIEYEDIISGENALNKDIFTKHTHKKGIAFSANDILFGKLRPYLLNIYLPEFSGIAVGDFWVLRSVSVLPKFLLFLIFTPRFMRVANISCGSKMPRSDWALVSESEFLVPSHDEQQSIAQYFSSLDSLIKATEKKIASLRQVKEASLQAMFPAEGETVPKVRFKGFGGEWKRIVVGDVGNTFSGLTGKNKLDFGVGEARYITFLNVLNNAQIDTDILEYVNVSKDERQNDVRIGDLFFNTSSETPEEVGMCSVLTQDVRSVYLNSFCFGFRISDSGLCPEYMAYLMRGPVGRRIMSILAQGATRFNLSKNNFLKASIPCPQNYTEQQKIASYFTNLDKQITIQTKRLEKLKLIKSACLDAMFV